MEYILWTILVPFTGFAAFIYDGIYIGATASRGLMVCMVFSAGLFVVSFFLCATRFGAQALYIAYFVHLVVRSVYLTFASRKNVWAKVSGTVS